jgi:nucleolar protein 56
MKEDREEKRRRLIAESGKGVSEAYSSSDHPIIQAINTYKEIEKIQGLVYERMEEWYGIYFPEFKSLGFDAYASLVSEIKEGKDADEEKLGKILNDEAHGKKLSGEIKRAGSRPELAHNEYEVIKEIAGVEKNLSELQSKLDSFIKESVEKSMPNIAYLVEYKIAAELLAKAGSLNRLATMPASTVQLLGAEKALFKHLKFGSKPPKYGVLFKLSQFSNASKKQRGRLARVYATKICIAARADAYTKRFIAEKLKESLDAATEKIMKEKD